MGLAFEVTHEDIANVLNDKHKRHATESEIQDAYDSLDMDKVEKAALYGDELDIQTQYAYEEIRKQLSESGQI